MYDDVYIACCYKRLRKKYCIERETMWYLGMMCNERESAKADNEAMALPQNVQVIVGRTCLL